MAPMLLNPSGTTKHPSDMPSESLIAWFPSCPFFSLSLWLASGTPFYWLPFFFLFPLQAFPHPPF